MILKSRKITCPNCKAMIEVGNPNLLSEREINCPNTACKALLHVRFDDGETILAERKKRGNAPGQLQYKGKTPFHLKEGMNTIGRADSKHSADFGIETDDVSMSRVHCQIEVVRLKDGTIKSIISDLRSDEKINRLATEINNEPLAQGDRIVLDDSDLIKMGNTIIRYVQE